MKTLSISTIFVAALSIFCASSALAVSTDIGVQYRPRFELSDRNFAPGGVDFFASHRARVMLSVTHETWKLQIDPQHVLKWGTETSTLSGASGSLDFHQAFIQKSWNQTYQLRIGRQEIAFDDHRVLGTVNWTQQGRAFDALRLNVSHSDVLGSTIFAAILADTGTIDEWLFGARTEVKFDAAKLSFPFLAEYAKSKAGGQQDFYRLTPGLNLTCNISDLYLNLSGYFQGGEFSQGVTRMATISGLVVAQVGYQEQTVGNLSAGADFLSGDKSPTDEKVGSFDTLFATNHKFYGIADQFLNVPVHAGGLGLVDIYFKWNRKLYNSVSGKLAFHQFLAARDTAAGNRSFGSEIDLELTARLTEYFNLASGYALFLAQTAYEDIGRSLPDESTGHWLYVQLNVSFSAPGN